MLGLETDCVAEVKGECNELQKQKHVGGADLKYCEEEGRLAPVTPVALRSALLETLKRNVSEE